MLTLPLHPFQEPAVDRFLARGNLLVAYDMGLGKTPIAIACAEELLEAGAISTALIVVPASLRYQWAEALAKFTDMEQRELKVKGEPLTVPAADACVIVDGGSAKRRALLAGARAADYVITSYNTVLTDIRAIRKLQPGLVILDEASAIKNFGAERTLKIKRSLTAPYRIALTGTPVENRPDEAFSIMEWVDPEVLGAFDLFDKTYIRRDRSGNVKGHKNLALFNRRLSRAMVRRSRAEPGVREYLPEVEHQQWYVEPGEATLAAYTAIADDLLSELLNVRGTVNFDLAAYYRGDKFSESTPLGRVMARQQAIELLLDHPQLLRQSAILYETTGNHGSKYAHEVCEGGLLDPMTSHHHLLGSPKLEYLAGKVADILGFDGSKILIFSRYPEMLQIIADRLAVPSVQYHGRMSATAKAAAVHAFGADPELRVFLSSHAGAYGTDMKMASHLINYDLAWSAGRADQINGRHQRASSEFSRVFIADLIMSGTLEERKLSMLQYKRRLSAAVVDGQMPRDGRIENDVITLTRFLQER